MTIEEINTRLANIEEILNTRLANIEEILSNQNEYTYGGNTPIAPTPMNVNKKD